MKVLVWVVGMVLVLGQRLVRREALMLVRVQELVPELGHQHGPV